VKIKTCIKLRRPRILSSCPDLCSLISDDYRLDLLSSNTTSVDRDITWLASTVWNAKLVFAVHATQVAFLDKCNEPITWHDWVTVYEDHRVLKSPFKVSLPLPANTKFDITSDVKTKDHEPA
jgi:hypothetical protein